MASYSDHTLTMTRTEIGIAVEWAAPEGWNPGLRDAECFHRTDLDGFLVGNVDREPVTCISVVRYGKLLRVPQIPHRQTRFPGHRLRASHLERRTRKTPRKNRRAVRFGRSGFALDWRNIRFMGAGGGADGKTEGIVPLSSIAINHPVSYDRPFFADDRRRFLECWTGKGVGHTSLGVIGANGLSGYVVIRACRNGFKVGALFADSSDDAERLFGALRHSHLSRYPRGQPGNPGARQATRYACRLRDRTVGQGQGP